MSRKNILSRWTSVFAMTLMPCLLAEANAGPAANADCTDASPRYSAATQALNLPMVAVGSSIYAAHLKLLSATPSIRFELISGQPCQSSPVNPNLPVYDIDAAVVRMPEVAVEFADGQVQTYHAELKRISTSPMMFELSLLEPAAGERYAVANTRYVNTLLGYGEVRGQDSFPAYLRSPAAGGDILWGTDLGLPVTLNTVGNDDKTLTLYLFGDTDQLDLAELADSGKVRKYRPKRDEVFVGPMGPFEGDAIGLSYDDNPADGVHLTGIYRNRETGETEPVCDLADPNGFRPVYLEGIHAGPCVQILPNTTPTGAWAVDDTLFMLAAVQNREDLANARSYLVVSSDRGLNWRVANAGQPFSQGGPAARFIHGFGLEVDARYYQDMKRSGPCGLPLPSGTDTRGLLLFGTGLWKASDVYLAFVSRTDLLAAADDPQHRLSPWYFAGTDYRTSDGKPCWSRSESDARPIIVASDLSNYARFENACGTSLTSAGVGYAKPIHVKETLADGTGIDRLVMLLSPAYQGVTRDGQAVDADLGTVLVTGEPWRPWIWNVAVSPERHSGNLPTKQRFRPLPVPAAENSGLEPTRPHCRQSDISWNTVSGYAPLLIERYTRVSDDGMGVDLYFVVSRWKVPSHPGDTGPETVDAYHYVVDVMRTTLRAVP